MARSFQKVIQESEQKNKGNIFLNIDWGTALLYLLSTLYRFRMQILDLKKTYKYVLGSKRLIIKTIIPSK